MYFELNVGTFFLISTVIKYAELNLIRQCREEFNYTIML